MHSIHEEWRAVKGWDCYEVSSCGNVRNAATGRHLAMRPTPKGYLRVGLCKKRKQVWRRVHRLVAEAFLGPPAPGEQVDHIDGNKQNNSAANLEWVTGEENLRRYWGEHSASEEQVRVAVALVHGGWSVERAAKRVGRTRYWLRDVCRGKTFKHLNLRLPNLRERSAGTPKHDHKSDWTYEF